MGRKRMSNAALIRAYYEKNPDAKPKDVALKLNVNPSSVYLVRSKMKQAKEPVKQVGFEVASEKAKAWQAANPWFGKDKRATDTALLVHEELVKGGIRVDSDEYYRLLDEHVQYAARTAMAKRLGLPDPVNHPPHYKTGGIETIDFIEAKGLNYRLGNVVKYITRSDHKGNRKEDLQKALWYLQREIEKA